MQSIPKENQIQTVGQLTSGIKLLLEDSFPAIWVKGEISNLKYQSSGHIYFSLKDKRAQIGAVMFKGDALRLPVRLKEGMEVIVFGNISVYEPRGNYQLIVRQCIEEGVGKLQAEFERLKNKLKEEGLFAPDRKKTLPALPRKVGIITSPTGAAIQDILRILQRRDWTGQIILFPSIVQGAEGAPDIIQKISWAETYGQLDLLVISRGGGSIEDLWNFNEEAVVRAVSNCSIPTISAVGHEIDFVLTDFAADKRAETPSAAAELISSGYLEGQNRLRLSKQDLLRSGLSILQQKNQQMDRLADKLKGQSPKRTVENHHIRMDELQERFTSRTTDTLRNRRTTMTLLGQRYESFHPVQHIQTRSEILVRIGNQFKRDVEHRVQSSLNTLDSMEKRLSSLGVDQVLKRGYALIKDRNDKILTSSAHLKNGQIIRTHFHDGERTAVVQNDNQMDLFRGI